MSSSGKVIKNSIFYSLGSVLGKAAGLILLPIYTRIISPEEYGVYTTVFSFVTTFSIVMSLSLRAAVMRFYATFGDDKEGRRRYLGTVVNFVCIFSLLLGGILLFTNSRYYFLSPFMSDIDFMPYAALGICALALDGVYIIYQGVLQARQEGAEYSVNSLCFLLFHAALNLFFLLVVKNGAVGLLCAYLISVAVFAVYGVVRLYVKKIIAPVIDLKHLWRSILYSLPILPHNLSNNIAAYISKLVLNGRASLSSGGLSDSANQIIYIVSTIQGSVNLALRPWFNEQMALGDEGKGRVSRLTSSLFSFSCFMCAGIGVFGQEAVIILMGKAYRDCWIIVPVLALSQAVAFIYYIHILAVMYNLRASKFAAVCSISGAVANILLSFFLVDLLYTAGGNSDAWGSMGAAIGTLAGKIVLTVLSIIISRHFEKVDFKLKSMLWRLALVTLFSAAALVPGYIRFVNGMGYSVWYLVYKIAVFAVFTAILLRREWPAIVQNKDVILKKLHIKKASKSRDGE